ncbi:hypothetical protein NIES592_04945 [Fischerella major NIES-592]|jgi:hypothetical protein|uniref:Porin n=1 Tax=Fischerella major NIES-592 TaxID=210994 RepID=A0A1U7H2S7_9CYAN|nr:hypothetical protein [Fischerella major]OKH15452.1 hypothetical protein NIES592_04945 [Fischerella major NIES-592]PMB52593.1 hypothetical protein CEN39_08960 [Fischerella thermalis CCMEE 5201]
MKFPKQSIPFVVATVLAVSASAAYSQTQVIQTPNTGNTVPVNPIGSNDLSSQPSQSYPRELCDFPYFCLPYPSKEPYAVCKPYAVQGSNGPLLFYRCYYAVPKLHTQ